MNWLVLLIYVANSGCTDCLVLHVANKCYIDFLVLPRYSLLGMLQVCAPLCGEESIGLHCHRQLIYSA